jgi:hypothetical protein
MLDCVNALNYLELSLCESGVLTGACILPPLERQASAGGLDLEGYSCCGSSDCAGGVGIGGTTVEVDCPGLAMYASPLSGEKDSLPASVFL